MNPTDETPVLPDSEHVPAAIKAALTKHADLVRLSAEARQKADLAAKLAEEADSYDAQRFEEALEKGLDLPKSVAEDRRRQRDDAVATATALTRMRDAARIAAWDALNAHRLEWTAAELPGFQKEWAQAKKELATLEATLARLEKKVAPLAYASNGRIQHPYGRYGSIARLANGNTGRALEALRKSFDEVEKNTIAVAETAAETVKA